MPEERLQKILARGGVASRRAAEELITSGRVRVNGTVVRELGTRADPSRDRIEVDGRQVAREQHVYYLVHKPRGMVTTLRDPEDRPSLTSLLAKIPERVYPVGRLDFHTSGALLLTNDGDLAQALLHPSRAVPKTYVVKLSIEADEAFLSALERGVTLDDGYRTQPARVEHLRDEDGKSWLQITITEGKNRQIHRMAEALGARVMRLSRVSFAGLSTEGLRPGDVRPLDRDEIGHLRREYLGITTAPERANDRSKAPRRADSRAAHADRTDRAGEHRTATRPSARAGQQEARAERWEARGASGERRASSRASAAGTRPLRQGAKAQRNARTHDENSRPTVDSSRPARHKSRPT